MTSSIQAGRRVHPILQWIRGMCSDQEPYEAIDAKLAEAVEVAKDLEQLCDRAVGTAIAGAKQAATPPERITAILTEHLPPEVFGEVCDALTDAIAQEADQRNVEAWFTKHPLTGKPVMVTPTARQPL